MVILLSCWCIGYMICVCVYCYDFEGFVDVVMVVFGLFFFEIGVW